MRSCQRIQHPPFCGHSAFKANCCSVAKLCSTLYDTMDCSMPGFPVLHKLPESAQTHVHWVSDATWPSHPLSSSSFAFNLSQHQGLFQWVSYSCQVAKVLELWLQNQSFHWIFRVDFLWDWPVWSSCGPWESQGSFQHHNLKTSMLWHSAFFMVQLSHLYMITGKTKALTLWTFVRKVSLGNFIKQYFLKVKQICV